MRRARVVWAVLVLVMGFVTVGPPATASEARAVSAFSDVPEGHPFGEAIAWLVAEGVTAGYPDGTFRPQVSISRQSMAAFLWRLEGEPDPGPGAPTFSDVPSGHPFGQAIAWLAGAGITTGFSDGTFRPTAVVTRQSMAAFLWRLEGEPDARDDAPAFPDVPSAHVFFEPVSWMAGEGITGGYADGNFRPGAVITRQTTAAFLHRLRVANVLPGEGDLVLSPDTIVVDGAALAAVTEVSDASITFSQLRGDLDGLEPGRVLAAGVAPNAPGGFLRRVTAVTPISGGVIVATVPAALDEAIEEGSISASFAIDAATGPDDGTGAGRGAAGQEWSAGFEGSVTAGPATLTASGEVSLEASVDLDIEIDKFPLPRLESASVTASASESVSAEVSISAEGAWGKQWDLGEFEFGTYTVVVGGFPIVVTPQVELSVAIDAEASGTVEMGAEQSASMSASVFYDEGDWGHDEDISNEASVSGPTLDASASVTVSATPEFELEFYKTAEIGVAVTPSLTVAADECEVWGNVGVDVAFEAEAEFLGIELFEVDLGPYDLYDEELFRERMPLRPDHCKRWIGTITITHEAPEITNTNYWGLRRELESRWSYTFSSDLDIWSYHPGVVDRDLHYAHYRYEASETIPDPGNPHLCQNNQSTEYTSREGSEVEVDSQFEVDISAVGPGGSISVTPLTSAIELDYVHYGHDAICVPYTDQGDDGGFTLEPISNAEFDDFLPVALPLDETGTQTSGSLTRSGYTSGLYWEPFENGNATYERAPATETITWDLEFL